MTASARSDVRITFGMIVLNGEPFVEYNLRALYPYAHEIIVIEGAAPAARSVASETGHSLDETLATLRRFKETEDPDGKLTIVTAEDENHPDGFWSEKDEMSAAYAKRATGNYLWQVDSDEFYLPEAMEAVIEMLVGDPGITAVSFPARTFWGGLDYEVRGYFLDALPWHRLFKWGLGYRYVSHRPPTVVDDRARDLRSVRRVHPAEMKRRDVYLLHYEILFPKQVIEKCKYYSSVEWTSELRRANDWAAECYLKLGKPFRVHMMYNHISWLGRYRWTHPPEVVKMVASVAAGRHPKVGLRPTADIDELLATRKYRITRLLLESLSSIERTATMIKESARPYAQRTAAWKALRAIKRTVRASW